MANIYKWPTWHDEKGRGWTKTPTTIGELHMGKPKVNTEIRKIEELSSYPSERSWKTSKVANQPFFYLPYIVNLEQKLF